MNRETPLRRCSKCGRLYPETAKKTIPGGVCGICLAMWQRTQQRAIQLPV